MIYNFVFIPIILAIKAISNLGQMYFERKEHYLKLLREQHIGPKPICVTLFHTLKRCVIYLLTNLYF